MRRQPEESWESIRVRESTKGELLHDVLTRRVWVWEKGQREAHCWHLLAQMDPRWRGEYKYSLNNAPEHTSKKTPAYMQGHRYWIERALEDAKGQCGMADYQLRGWNGWHHHMALVMMAMLFMLSEGLCYKDDYPPAELWRHRGPAGKAAPPA